MTGMETTGPGGATTLTAMETTGPGGATTLIGKVAVVTGGGRGIGRAIARTLAHAGADVALCARTGGEIEAVAAELRGAGRRAVATPLDVVDGPAVRAFAAQVKAELGRVDILVNNAGGSVERKPIAESTPEAWWRAVEVNLYGTYLMTRALLEHMTAGAKIINIGSGMGHEPRAGNASYNVAKAGVHMFTQCLALEVWPRGIEVNEVLPGPVANGLDPEAQLAAAAGRPPPLAPSERLKHPDRVAELVLWLATRAEGGPTGQVWSLARRPF
jgi:NAD(P)-dependent dehydrogenase (short-subunit alcohol dehydrogenase family)